MALAEGEPPEHYALPCVGMGNYEHVAEDELGTTEG
jgi:hypothetical protein